MAKYIILDTETTGAGEKDRVIQLGYMVLDPGKPTEIHNELCSSEVPIEIGAMEVHNITPEMIEGKPLCIEIRAYQRLIELNSPENYMIIHNAPFDIGMLEKEGFALEMKLIDTLRVAKHVFPDSEYHRLQYFRYALELYKEEESEAAKLGIELKAHDALGDVLFLKLLLSKLREAVEKQFPGMNAVEKMVALTKEPVFITKPMRFGKHKGKTIQELAQEDAGYLRWMMENMQNLDEDVRYTIRKVLEGY
ncbi:exonuclease domain-containing protein [Sulfurimonas sp. HSL3-7]|uniref:exonuclease domain-containing protein n=1 Tax=Sulfonitrofixus jiaomeiensis TaxID=3131938 RepID=UPI0031F74CEB